MSPWKLAFCSLTVCGTVSLLADAAWAQRSGGTGATTVTPFSNSTGGSSGTTTGASNVSSGESATGTSGNAGAGGGTSTRSTSAAASGPQFNTGDGSLGDQLMRPGGFAGAGQGTTFVGSPTATGTQQGRRTSSQPQFSIFGGGNFNNFNNFGNNLRQGQFGTNAVLLPRPQLRIAFTVPDPSPQTLQTNATMTLQNVQQLPVAVERFPGVSLTVGDAGRVTLSGTVPDEQARQLAEMLVRLEPGVREVHNELSVTGSAPAYAP